MPCSDLRVPPTSAANSVIMSIVISVGNQLAIKHHLKESCTGSVMVRQCGSMCGSDFLFFPNVHVLNEEIYPVVVRDQFIRNYGSVATCCLL